MATYQVTQRIETIGTAKAASTSAAESDAAAAVRDAIVSTDDDALEAVTTTPTDVYEFPSGPFDPYRVTVDATISVLVDADDESDAFDTGERRLESILAAADLDEWEFVGSKDVTAPA